MGYRVRVVAAAVGLVGLIACDGGKGPTLVDTGDSDTPPGTPTPQAPPLITDVSGTCVGSVADVSVRTQNLAYGGTLFVFDTSSNPAYDEEAPLVHVQHDPGGAWDEWGLRLLTGAAPDTWEPGQTTVFLCDSWALLTLVVEVRDLQGDVADCAVFGHNPAEILDGTWPDGGEPNTNGTVIGDRFAGCVVR